MLFFVSEFQPFSMFLLSWDRMVFLDCCCILFFFWLCLFFEFSKAERHMDVHVRPFFSDDALHPGISRFLI